MHYFQQRYLRQVAAFPAMAGLLTIDLPNKGYLSGIEFRVWGLPGPSDSLPNAWLHDQITRVEVIVNGSQVVKSYDARQLQAMMLYKRTSHYGHNMMNVGGVTGEEFFYINLGRHYHDLDFQLDLGRVNDPELRITYDFNATTFEGWPAGQAMAAVPSYSVICHLLRDEPTPPRGYIKTAEIARVNNAASLMFNLNVPRGPTYSNLYLQSFWVNNGLSAVLNMYEVNINSDDLIPIRTNVQDLEAAVTRMYGLVETTQRVWGLGNVQYPYPIEVGMCSADIDAGVVNSALSNLTLWGNIEAFRVRNPVTGVWAAVPAIENITIRGAFPFSVAAIPLFNPWDEATWVNTTELGDFWVRIEETPGVKAGVMKLLGDEVVTTYL